MTYMLDCFVSKKGVLPAGKLKHSVIVPLNCGFEMLPCSERFRENNKISDDIILQQNFNPSIDLCDLGDKELLGQIDPVIERLGLKFSLKGDVAYLGAEFFGGEGCQTSVVFSNKEMNSPPMIAAHAINSALRALGVEKGKEFDEFDALGLGKHRMTENWENDAL